MDEAIAKRPRGRPRRSTQVVAPSSGVTGVLVKTETVETPLDCEPALALHNGPAYADPLADQIYKLRLLGLSRKAISHVLGIDFETLGRWVKGDCDSGDIREAYHAGGQEADSQVAYSLFRRAVGYDRVLVDEIVNPDGTRMLKRHVVHIPGDVGAAKFWLQSRQGEHWQDNLQKQLADSGATPVLILTPVSSDS